MENQEKKPKSTKNTNAKDVEKKVSTSKASKANAATQEKAVKSNASKQSASKRGVKTEPKQTDEVVKGQEVAVDTANVERNSSSDDFSIQSQGERIKKNAGKNSKRKKAAIATAVVLLVTASVAIPTAVYLSRRKVSVDISNNIDVIQEYTVNIKRGATIKDIVPQEIKGYTFVGFYKDAELTVPYKDTDKINKNMTIYAKYEANVYKVTFPTSPAFTIEGEDIVNNQVEIEYNTEYRFKLNLATGYDESDITVKVNGETITPDKEGYYTLTIYGDTLVEVEGVEINTYEVTFYDSLEKNEMYQTLDIQYNQLCTYTGVTPTKHSTHTYTYTFIGWVDAEGNEVDLSTTHIVTDLELFANFREEYIEYTISKPEQVNVKFGDLYLSNTATLHYGDIVEITYDTTEGHDVTAFSVSGAEKVEGSENQYKITGNLVVTYSEEIQTFTVQIESSNSEYGSINQSSITVEYGTRIAVDGNTLTIGEYTITATPTADNPTYDYVFVNWTNAVSEVTGDITITANFERTMDEYVVSIVVNNASYGTVSKASVIVNYNTPITVDGNKLTINGQEIIATATAGDAQYTYTFTGWTNATDPITEDREITANFTRETNTYTVSIQSKNTRYGTVDKSSVTVEYGTEITVSGNTITIGDTTITATPSISTAQYSYSFASWSTGNTTVTGEITITATFTQAVQTYTVTWKNWDGSTLETDTLVPYGTTPEYNGETPTRDETASHSYTFTGWDQELSPVTGDVTYIAQFEQVYVLPYEINEAGEITKYTGSATEVVIPSSYSMLEDGTIIEGSDHTITGIADASGSSEGAFANTNITSITIPEGFEKIGAYAFNRCSSLTSVTIPSSVTSIGRAAFYGCSSLTSITIPDSVTSIGSYAFQDCSSLTSVTIGEGVTSIGSWAFYYCRSLTSINIPDSVTSIGEWAFYNCTSLTEINFNATNMSDLSSKNYVFAYAGQDGEGITVNIGANVTRIPAYLFKPYTSTTYSPKITTVNFAENSQCTSIGYSAFSSCTSLTSVTIGEGVTSIGSQAFQNCSSLTSISIPDSVTSIGSQAFYSCDSLTDVYYTGDINDWVSISFVGYGDPLYYGANLYVNGNELVTEANIDTATSINAYAFRGCTSITSVTIGDQLTSIGSQAFNGCSSLTSITIGEGVTSIGSYAFSECTSLTEINFNATNMSDLSSYNYLFWKAGRDGEGITVNIGANVTRIPAYLFNPYYNTSNSPKITTINFAENSQCTSIGDRAFEDCTSLTEINFNATNMSDLSSGNRVFYNAGKDGKGITVNIGANVTRIPAYLFNPNDNASYSPKITTVNFAENSQCTSIGDYAFYNCTSITDVYYSGDINDWVSISFGSYGNPLNNGANLYINNELVTEANIDTATSIGDRAFYGYDKLTSITIGDQVTSIGDYAFVYCSGLTSITIPSSVTSIGYSAFSSCSSLTSITIPDSVTSIGDYAFSSCSSLTEINFNATNMSDLSSGNRVFYNAGKDGEGITVNIGANVTRIPAYLFNPYNNSSYSPKITTVNFAENSQCTSIGDRAFSYCTSLTSITIPSSVTSIGANVFYGCYSLVYVVNKSSVEFNVGNYGTSTSTNPILEIVSDESEMTNLVEINGNLYKDYNEERYFIKNLDGSTEIEIDSSCTQIYQYAFYDNADITSVSIPDSVTSIGEYAFYECSSLTSVTIGESVTSIGDYAFYGCSSLTSITIPESVTSIGEYAFYECSGLTSVTIGDGVTSIGDYAFYECSGLTSVTIGDSVTSIGSHAFYGCSSLTSITIPSSVTSIGYYAFGYCDSLTSITIPDSVTSIGDSAFYYCDSLTSITIPDSVTSIGDSAFNACSSLTSITIPDSVTSIGDSAFYRCTSLTSVTIESNYAYANAGTEYYQCGRLLQNATEVRVLISCIEEGSTNSYLENTATFTKTTSEDEFYYIYTKI